MHTLQIYIYVYLIHIICRTVHLQHIGLVFVDVSICYNIEKSRSRSLRVFDHRGEAAQESQSFTELM